jgi:hypothetical protein
MQKKIVNPFKKVSYVFLTCLFFWHIIGVSANAQEAKLENTQEAGKEDAGSEEKFTNSGLIYISNKFELSKDRKHISFKIINNAGRSIANLFGWVYKYEQDGTGKKINFALANYPHKSGVYVLGRSHKPGEKGMWRFILKETVPAEATPKFLLLVNMNSIFFAKVEVLEPDLPLPLEGGGEDKKKSEEDKKPSKKSMEKP